MTHPTHSTLAHYQALQRVKRHLQWGRIKAATAILSAMQPAPAIIHNIAKGVY